MRQFLLAFCVVGVAMSAPLTYTIIPAGGNLTPEMLATLQQPLQMARELKIEGLPDLTNIMIPNLPAAPRLQFDPMMPKIEGVEPEELLKPEEMTPENFYRIVSIKQAPQFQTWLTNAQTYWTNVQEKWQEWVSNMQNNGLVAIFNSPSSRIRIDKGHLTNK